MTTLEPWLSHIQQAWQNLQHQQPLLHYITNSVAANYAANVTLACGASPALIDNPFEAAGFCKIANALSINLGTPTTEQVQAMQMAAQSAHQHQIPWVLDPVGYGSALPWRSEIVDQLLAFKPQLIRGNASEISTLAGNFAAHKGVDSTLSSEDVYCIAPQLWQHAPCIAISGRSDFIVSQELDLVIQVNGGSALQPKVTAMGCALGALCAAYISVSSTTIGTVAAHVHFAIAAKLAMQASSGIGSFNVAFLDELSNMNTDKIAEHLDIALWSLNDCNCTTDRYKN